jgi:hypothetical protein
MLATIVVLASVTFDEPPPPSRFVDERPAALEVAERFIGPRNLTLLEVDLGSVRMAESGLLQLSVQAIYTGKGRGGPRVASLHLITRWGKAPRYRDDHAVTLRVDGEPIALKADNYAVNEPPNPVSESIYVRLEGDDWPRRLASARVVKGSIGSDTFQLQPLQIEALKSFVRYVQAPKLAVTRPVRNAPGAPEPPDRSAIPTGQAVVWNEHGSRSCDVARTLDALDAPFDASASVPRQRRLEVLRETRQKQLEAGERISVPSGTHVRIIERRDRREARSTPLVARVEIVDGPQKGFTGWCVQAFLITSLQTPADRTAAEAETIWGTASVLERSGNRKLAIETYREIVKLVPDTPRAKQAEERIKALTEK